MGCVKLGSLASRGWLTCPPPPLSILIPAMHSMGGTGFISMLDGDHWRGEGASMRDGGREGGRKRGDRGTETKDPTTHHESKRSEVVHHPPPPQPTPMCMQAPGHPPKPPPPPPHPPPPDPPPRPPPTPIMAKQTSYRRKKGTNICTVTTFVTSVGWADL